jgi:hypothetical protein
MTLEELLRSELHDFADRPVEEPNEDDLRDELARADRRKLLQRTAAATFVLVLAVLLALHLAPSGPHNGPMRIEHRPTTETTIAIPHRAVVTPPPQPSANGQAPEGNASPTGSSPSPNPASPIAPATPSAPTPGTVPGASPAPTAPSSDFWAIASQAQDGHGTPTIVVFGHAPTGHHVTVTSSLGSHDSSIDNQGDFRWTDTLSGKLPAFPITFHVACNGCGETDLTVAEYDPAPSQPTPDGGFSVFAAEDGATGVFTIGGFAPMRGATTATMTSAYGNAQFDVVHNLYGGRVSFVNVPLNTSFTVTVSSGGQTEQLTLVRN